MVDTPRVNAVYAKHEHPGDMTLDRQTALNIELGELAETMERELASLRAEKERSDALLKDWNALMLASTMDGIPEAFRSMASVPKLWPNEWHQDCAAVAFMIKTLREQKERAEAERDEAIRMRDRHAEASKAQNEDITALMAERDAALKDAERLDKANTELAQESCILRLVLGELVDAVNGTNDLDEMDGEEYQIASKRLDDAMAKAIPHTEEAIQRSFIDAAVAARKV